MAIPKKKVTIGGETFDIPDLSKKAVYIILIILIGIWVLFGFYIVKPDEQGVVQRFGKYTRITSPGIHYHAPFPIETVSTPSIGKIRVAEIGFRSRPKGPPVDRPNESLMLTGNLNIIDCDMIVQYRIIDAVAYQFNVRDLESTVHAASEASLRQVIGKHEIDEALTTGKGEIQDATKVQLQEILDSYNSGLIVIEVQMQDVHPPKAVINAFKDVASAKEDMNTMINQAQGYYNDLIPRTRGKGAQMVKQAEAWAAERVTMAEGDADNFIRILDEYRSSRNVTRKRLLLETMEEILPGLQKYILKSDKSGNLMNVLGIGTSGALKGGKK
ncbi:MAG: FtsH protease activity modulator HflK [Candidatus Hatepunaea meridiana]|nr:FtsH protease activity modulator HflK [Candidatus Hatepunaea meridiana]